MPNDRDREWARLAQIRLRQELQDLETLRESFEGFEREIAAKVRQLRTERSWTQVDLAERMDRIGWAMDQAAVSRLEAGRRPIRAAEMQALAAVFGVPVTAFLYIPAPGEPPAVAAMRKQLQDAEARIEALGKDVRSILSIYAQALQEREQIAHVLDQAAKEADNGERSEAP